MLPLLLALLTLDAGAPPRRSPQASAAQAWPKSNPFERWHPLFPDLERLPDLHTCAAMMQFLEGTEETLHRRLADPICLEPERLDRWLADVQRVKAAWSLLHQIRYPYTLECDRERVAELRKLLGEKDWWLGRMPDLDYSFFERVP